MKFGEAAINWIPGILKRKFPGSAKSVHKGHLSGRLARRLDEARAGDDDRQGLRRDVATLSR
jgi:hypothetical protein